MVRTVECRSILTICGIPGVDLSLNIDIKENAAQSLKAVLRKADGKTGLLSGVTDPYKSVEQRKGTARCRSRRGSRCFPGAASSCSPGNALGL